jgi:hypothetical protein
MKYRQLMWSMGFVGALGLGVPGCLWFGNDENEGRICASPIEGGTYCVAANSGPSVAWDKAKANGTEPIQMWAEWPDNVDLRDVVSSPNLLNAWLDDVVNVTNYLRVTRGNAESYYASLSGILGENLLRARIVQEDIIAEKAVDPQGRVAQALLDKAAKETDPLKAKITADKQTMNDVKTIVDQAKVDSAPFASQYKTLVDDFVAYRATEGAETLLYTKWSHEVSGAGLDDLDAVENNIVEAAHAASAKPNELLVAGMKLSAQILQFETTAREALSPHADFMVGHGARVPDMSSGALRSIHAMLGYAQQRVARSDATAKGLLLGAEMRRRALQLLATAPSPVRATTANALLANASTKFENAAHVRVDAVATTSMSNNLGLPYLAKRYDEFAALSQMAPLCNATSSSWREAGCASMRPKFKDATQYLKVTLPAEISQGLEVMKNKGADPVVIEKVQQKLKAGDIKGAALAHDALLSSLEGT